MKPAITHRCFSCFFIFIIAFHHRIALEHQLAHRLAELEGGKAFGHAVQEIFMLNDMNGDGSITRDEWLGSDAVFDALDQDHDGLISQEDVRQGFGAALALTSV